MRIVKGTAKPRVCTEVRAFVWALFQAQTELLRDETWKHKGDEEETRVIQTYLERLIVMGLNDPDMLRLCRRATDVLEQVMDTLRKTPDPVPRPFRIIDGGMDE